MEGIITSLVLWLKLGAEKGWGRSLLRVKECGYSQEKDARYVAVTEVFIARIIPVGTRLEAERSFKELGTFCTNVPYSAGKSKIIPKANISLGLGGSGKGPSKNTELFPAKYILYPIHLNGGQWVWLCWNPKET